MPSFIRIHQLASTPKRPGRLPVSPSTIWRWSATGQFPKPVQLAPGTTAWRLEEVEAWESSRPRGPAA